MARLTRRAFLGGLIGWGGGMLAASLPLGGCAGPNTAPADRHFFSAKEWTTLDQIAERLIPGSGGGQVAQAADRLLALAPPRLQSDLKRLLFAVEDLTWLSGRFAPFSALPPDSQWAWLESWRQGPLAMQRQGYIALVRLVGMLHYTQPEAWKQIGYPGPWVGRIDAGLGLDNQGPMAANPNPHIYERGET